MRWRSLGESNPCFSLERAAEETRNRGLAGTQPQPKPNTKRTTTCSPRQFVGDGTADPPVPAHQLLDR